jgi:hypothetical protein
MIRAAAVLIHLPSPRGFGGTGESWNVTLGGGDGVEAFIAALDDPLVGKEGFELLDMFWM